MSLNVHIYPSPITNETRMMKITKSLVDNSVFEEVKILGTQRSELPTNEQIDSAREIVRIKRSWGLPHESNIKKLIGLIEWFCRAFLYLLPKKVECINPHSLSVLPFSIIIKFIKGCKVVYDTHEYETETTASSGARKKIAKKVEGFFIRFCDEVIVVSDPIAQGYKDDYQIQKPHVILNAPYLTNESNNFNIFREKFSLSESDTIFLYQGGLFHNRGVEVLLEVFKQAPKDKILIFLGYGELENLVKEAAKTEENIFFHEAVSPTVLHKYTASADIGFCLIQNSCLSYYYSLPNKLFEYLHANLKIVGSNFPEIKRVLDETQMGEIIVDQTVEEILKVVLGIKKQEKLAPGISVDLTTYSWQAQEKKLLSIYQGRFK